MNEEERARKRENSVRERRKARVCIVVMLLRSLTLKVIDSPFKKKKQT